jgi:hypothetical protein
MNIFDMRTMILCHRNEKVASLERDILVVFYYLSPSETSCLLNKEEWPLMSRTLKEGLLRSLSSKTTPFYL